MFSILRQRVKPRGGAVPDRRSRRIHAVRGRHAVLKRSLRAAASTLVVVALAAGALGIAPAHARSASPRARLVPHAHRLTGAETLARRSMGRPTSPAHGTLRLRRAAPRNPVAEPTRPTHTSTATGLAIAIPAVAPATPIATAAALLRFSSRASRTRGHPARA